MIRLLFTEIKKIWKSKLNILLFIALLVFSGYRMYTTYFEQNNLLSTSNYVLQNTKGNNLTKLGYYKEADALHHAYKGRLNDTLLNKMEHDYQTYVSSYERKTPDVDYMLTIYGKGYEAFLKNASNGSYTIDEIYDHMRTMKVNGFTSEERDEKHVKAFFEYYYKEDRVLALYNLLYGNWYEFESTRPDGNHEVFMGGFDNKANRIQDKKNMQTTSTFQTAHQNIAQERGTIGVLNYYDQKYLDSSNEYDSVIGNTLFVNALHSIEFMTLVVLVLCLSNTFAMEKRCKTDQILVPSGIGWKKIVMAKVGSGLVLSLVLILVQVIMATVFSSLLVPLRSLDLLYVAQARVSMNYNVLEYMFTYKEIICSGIGLMLLASMATSLITILCSYITKSRFICAIPLLLIIIVTGSMDVFAQLSPDSIVDGFLPSHMFHFTQYFQFTHSSLINVQTVFNKMVELKDIVMIFWIFMIVIMTLAMYLHSKKYHTVHS